LSTRTLAVALEALGHAVSHTVLAELLHGLAYSLQGNVKTREGRQHSDRDAQFRYIARQVQTAQRRRQPTISVDTNYDPARVMDTLAGAAGAPAGVDRRAAADLIRQV
jgi:hypothetical protein